MNSVLGISIKKKLILVFLAITLIPLAIFGAISYSVSRNSLSRQIERDFDAISEGKEQAVVQYLLGARRALGVYSHARTIVSALTKINNKTADSPQALKELQSYIDERLKLNPLIQEFLIMDKQGRVIAATEPKEMGLDKSEDTYFTGAKQKDFFIKDVYVSKVTGKTGFVCSEAIKDLETGEYLGVFAERLTLQSLNEILADRTGLGETGENYIVNKDGLMITESRFIKDAASNQKVDTEPIRFFRSTGKNWIGMYRGYGGSIVLGATSGNILKDNFDYLGWVVLSTVKASEALAPVTKLGSVTLFTILVVGAITIFIALWIANNIADPIKKLAEAASEVAGGDLAVSVPVKGSDEIGMLGNSFNSMIKNLNAIISKAKDAMNQITSASNEILAASQQQAASATEQSSAVAETSSAAAELSKSAEAIGESIKRVHQAANHALNGMVKIKDAISKTGERITSLSEKSQQIGKITDLINDVADQTNLLAVNAAIEAARAGEQGRGFTVVADEIRKLADSTAKSTKDITALIEIIQHEMTNAIMSMEESVSNVNEEAKLAQESADSAKEITMSATQQISGSKQISDAMGNINQAMREIATGASQAQQAVKQLTALAKELKDITEKFKVS